MSIRQAQKSRLQRIFPDTKVAAYYDPFSQIINISKYDKADYENLDPKNPSLKEIDKLSLLEHELAHWIDHVSTLWGQKNLVSLFNALNARAKEDINEFWRIKSLYTSYSSDDFFDYFTEEYKIHTRTPRTPWRYQISSGLRFSSEGKPEYAKPILFLRFNSFDDVPLIRVPVSVASILESNAINAEYFLKTAIASEIPDIVEKQIQLSRISSEWKSILYNKDFALYTVIAHLTANLNNENDAVWTYNVSSAIGTTVLNLPNEVYKQMYLTKVGNEEWDRRIKEFSNIRDKGFTFYNLLKNLVDKNDKKHYTIDSLLASSALPSKVILEEMVVNEMDHNLTQLIDGPFKNIAIETIKNGIEIFKIRGIDGKNKDFKKKFSELDILPTVIFGDTYFDDSNFEISNILQKLEGGNKLSMDEKYLTLEFYDKKFNEFIKACGV